jgi:hypothetical protein
MLLNDALRPVNSELLLEICVTLLSHIELKQRSMNVANLVEQEVCVCGVQDSCTIRTLGILRIDAVNQVIEQDGIL